MKRSLFFAALIIAGAFFTSCQKVSTESLEYSKQEVNSQDFKVEHHDFSIDQLDFINDKFSKMADRNNERLSTLGNNSFKSCTETVVVPDDYATIQEAVDAVCAYGDVIVKPGVYNEDAVVINKPGVHVKAIGDVLLNGGFGINDYVNDVTIQNFKIDLTTAYYIVGIGGFYNNGCNIQQNTIYGANHIGIYFRYCNDLSIKQNHVSGPMDYGIFIDGFIDGGTATNNTIAQNYVSDMSPTPGVGILLRGDCDNNTVKGNTVMSTTWGISLEGHNLTSNASCDYNVIKNNIVKNNVENGIEIYYYVASEYPIGNGPTENTIGPNNRSNNNGLAGIDLWEYSNNNHVFNNSALNNATCDIINDGTGNTFKKNIAGCTIGVN